jgi:7-cyano-7-deazaguanine synthase in queuosine biosynthesis
MKAEKSKRIIDEVGIDRSQEQVAVMFSGGTDSLLASAIGAETFKKVHLLTYHVSQMSNWERSRNAAQLLVDHYGADKVVHQIIDNDALFRKLYLGQYFRDLRKYGLYINCTVCMACGFAFRVRSVVYCRKHGCRYLWDGLQSEGAEEHLYPLLNPDRQQAVVDFCREYGVIKESPVYNISRTDHVLYEKGITTKKQLKLRALGDAGMEDEGYKGQLEQWHSTQADCTGNVVGLTYLVGAFLPRCGQERNLEFGLSYHEERMDIARDLLDRYFAGEPIPFLDIP